MLQDIVIIIYPREFSYPFLFNKLRIDCPSHLKLFIKNMGLEEGILYPHCSSMGICHCMCVVLWSCTLKLYGDMLVPVYSLVKLYLYIAWGLTAHVYSFVKLHM